MDERTLEALTDFEKELEPVFEMVTRSDFFPPNLTACHCGEYVPKIISFATNGNCISCYFEKRYGIIFPQNNNISNNPDLQMHFEVKAKGRVVYNSKVVINALTKHIHTQNPIVEDETERPFKLAKKSEEISRLRYILPRVKV